MIQVKLLTSWKDENSLETYINDFLKNNDCYIKEVKDIKYKIVESHVYNTTFCYNAMIIYETL